MWSWKDEILFNTYQYGRENLNEMAAAELKQIVNLIKSGKLKEAANKYIELGGNSAPSGVSKTVNSYLTKNPELPLNQKHFFEQFKSAVEVVRREKGIETKRPDTYKVGTTGTTRSGEEVSVKGLSAQARHENVLKVIDKQKKEVDAERAMLDAGTDDVNLRKMARDFINDMQFVQLTDEDKKFITILKNFYKTGVDKEKAIDIMQTMVDEGEKTMEALKQRVASGGMIKPSEQKLLSQAEKYKKIDALKAQKSLEADKQKQLEQKNES